MIVPQNRLLLWIALVVLPFALLAAIEPAAAPVALGLIVGLMFVAALDALSAGRGLAGIGAALPDVVRMSKDREAKFEVRLRNERQRACRLRVGLALPPEVESASEAMDVVMPKGSEWSRLLWTCVPRKRGSYALDAVYLEGASPLGFWAARKRMAARAELRVYPNLLTERKNLAALFLNRGVFGTHAQRQVGRGREFEKLREYVPGDSYDEIHWKATARRGHPITKVFQIERTQEVYVVIDTSRLSAREPVSSSPTVGSVGVETRNSEPGTSTLERFVTAALVLGLAAEQQGDLFGLITFADRIGRFVRAKNGKAHYGACRDALYTMQPQLVSPDFDELCTFIRLRLRRRALLVFLTSLDDPALAEGFVRNAEVLRHQHLVLVNMLQPRSAVPVFTNPSVATLDDLYEHLGGHLQWHRLRELEKVLQRRGVHFSLLSNERLSAELVSQYLSVKRRQLL